METVPYADFSLKLHQRVMPDRVPVNGAIEVTQRCPLRCLHCYNNLPMQDQEARLSELSFEEHCHILDQITEAGCLWLLFTGGEVFARKDFLDIYTYAKQKGLLITLFTNGVLIDKKIATYLSEWRPFSIEISIYGRTKETYEQITGVPGSYERCMRGINLLMGRGLPLKLKTMALTINRQELWEMKQFAEQVLGLDFRFDAMINPRIDHSHLPLEVRLSPQDIVELDLQDPKRAEEWQSFATRFNRPLKAPEQCDALYHCGGGVSTFAIGPSGMLSTCVLSHDETYDLQKGSFREGWEHFLLRVKQQKITRPTKCVACEIKPMCGMCPANASLEHGDPEQPVDFLCQVAHLRAYALGLPIPPHGKCEYCEGGTRHEELLRSVASMKDKLVMCDG